MSKIVNEWVRNWLSKYSREVEKTEGKTPKKLRKNEKVFCPTSERDEVIVSSKPCKSEPHPSISEILMLSLVSLAIQCSRVQVGL